MARTTLHIVHAFTPGNHGKLCKNREMAQPCYAARKLARNKLRGSSSPCSAVIRSRYPAFLMTQSLRDAVGEVIQQSMSGLSADPATWSASEVLSLTFRLDGLASHAISLTMSGNALVSLTSAHIDALLPFDAVGRAVLAEVVWHVRHLHEGIICFAMRDGVVVLRRRCRTQGTTSVD